MFTDVEFGFSDISRRIGNGLQSTFGSDELSDLVKESGVPPLGILVDQ